MDITRSYSLHSLSKKELEILQYVYDHSKDVCNMSIQAFAKEVHYSTSTVLRFCRKLGFSGYPEFKYSLRIKDDSKAPEQREDISYSKIKSSVFTYLEGSGGLLNTDSIFQAADILLNNPPIYLHKPGGLTNISVDYMESMLFMLGCKYVLKSSSKKLTNHLIKTVDKNSVFIFLSNSGAFSDTVDLAKKARLNGMIVISVSSIENNDLAEASDYSLRFFSGNRDYQGADLSPRLSMFLGISSLMELINAYSKGGKNANLSK